ncbi:MAG: hypothetical protein ACKOWK_01860 [Micrococcales bacterium]
MNKKTTKQISSQRSLYLIDAENAVGTSHLTEAQVAKVRTTTFDLTYPGKNDQVYVATSHHNMEAASFGWPQAQHEFLSGEDGADFLIIKKMIDVGNAVNFEKVYLASGDGCYTECVNFLMLAGVKVTILARRGSLAAELKATGAEIIWLDADYALAA